MLLSTVYVIKKASGQQQVISSSVRGKSKVACGFFTVQGSTALTSALFKGQPHCTEENKAERSNSMLQKRCAAGETVCALQQNMVPRF